MKLAPFEFQIFRSINDRFRGERLLLACSGGRDSMALLSVLISLREKSGFDFEVAYVHHGAAKKKSTTAYRDKASTMVERAARSSGIVFHRLEKPLVNELVSESELRDYRLSLLAELRDAGNFDRVLFAHHSDDLLETRLIRLIRGTSARGLEAMREFECKTARPFLKISTKQLEEYAKSIELEFLEDPSNSDLSTLRNWIRRSWLSELESVRPGARAAMARSLDSIAEAVRTDVEMGIEDETTLDRKLFESVPKSLQRENIADTLRKVGRREFSTSQIDEVVKRLAGLAKSGQRQASFEVSKTNWSVDSQMITVRAPP